MRNCWSIRILEADRAGACKLYISVVRPLNKHILQKQEPAWHTVANNYNMQPWLFRNFFYALNFTVVKIKLFPPTLGASQLFLYQVLKQNIFNKFCSFYLLFSFSETNEGRLEILLCIHTHTHTRTLFMFWFSDRLENQYNFLSMCVLEILWYTMGTLKLIKG